MVEITQIELLVHPDFHSFNLDRSDCDYPYQKVLRGKWLERAQYVSSSPGAVMFYFPAIGSHIAPEYDRRSKLLELYGQRFFLFPGFERPAADRLKSLFDLEGFSFSPDQVRLNYYGEYRELCVTKWGNHIGEQLQIPETQRELIRYLSISYHLVY